MFNWIPTRAWLLILISLFCWPALVILSRRVQLSDLDHKFPTRRQTALAIAWLIIAFGVAIFIFTPQAEAFAYSQQFLPILLAVVAVLAVNTTVRGFMTGQAEPLIRGSWGPYSRLEQPRCYWASQSWNVLMSGFMVWLEFKI